MHRGGSTRHNHESHKATNPHERGPVNSPHRIWIHRNASLQSQSELDALANKFKPNEAGRKITAFSVTLIRTEDIDYLINQTCLRTLHLQDFIARVLRTKYPDTFSKSVIANVNGIKQYGEKIGLDINYPELEKEFDTISKVVTQHFGAGDGWLIDTHVTLAEGSVANLSNLSELQQLLPKTVDLTPVRTSIIPVVTPVLTYQK